MAGRHGRDAEVDAAVDRCADRRISQTGVGTNVLLETESELLRDRIALENGRSKDVQNWVPRKGVGHEENRFVRDREVRLKSLESRWSKGRTSTAHELDDESGRLGVN